MLNTYRRIALAQGLIPTPPPPAAADAKGGEDGARRDPPHRPLSSGTAPKAAPVRPRRASPASPLSRPTPLVQG
jgi:hypothetical protein